LCLQVDLRRARQRWVIGRLFKRRDNTYQVELQLKIYPYLPQRMLYCWSDICGAQIQSGQDYTKLQPVTAIWLLGDNLFKDTDVYHHHFQMADLQHQHVLSDHCSVHVLELPKWQHQKNLTAEDRWMYFFKEAENWTELPEDLQTDEMRQAMAVLKRFSQKEQDYHLYQSRQNILREELARQTLFDEATAGREQERRLKEQHPH